MPAARRTLGGLFLLTSRKGVDMERKDLVTVCTVTSPTEAEIIRGVLQSAGIACEIGGEGQAGFAGVWAIDVLARAGDADKARKHLKQLKRNIRLRRKRRAQAKKEKAAGKPSEAIQELKPRTQIKKKKPRLPE
jgi:hypothetical protein